MDDNSALLELVSKGSEDAEEKLITENMGLVRSVARRFLKRGYELDDLLQIGSIGLIKAVKRFNTEYNVCFSTYAVPMIIGEIKRFLRDDGSVKISRSLKELAMKGYCERERLSNRLGREPTVGEVATECGTTAEELVQAFEACTPPDSIDRELFDSGTSVGESIPAEDCEEKMMNRLLVDQALSYLNARERKVIVMRYFQAKTQSETSKIIGVSQVQVSRIEKAALEKMKKSIGAC